MMCHAGGMGAPSGEIGGELEDKGGKSHIGSGEATKPPEPRSEVVAGENAPRPGRLASGMCTHGESPEDTL